MKVGAGDAQLIFWYAVYLLYWYKNTNSDAAGKQMCPKFECALGDGTLPLGPHFTCCYWYKRTHTDTQQALGYRRRNSAAAPLGAAARPRYVIYSLY